MLHPPPAAGQPAWVHCLDADGFRLEKPRSWRVRSGAAGEIEVSDPLGTAAAILRSRQLPMHADLAWWLRYRYPASELGLHNVIMLQAQNLGPQIAHAAFDYGSQVFQGHASVIAIRQGPQACLYIAAAARTEFARYLPELTRILCSLRLARMEEDPNPSVPIIPPDLIRLLGASA